jgi:hypothetical protein
MIMNACVLRDMAPVEVRRRLEHFAKSYVADWEEWLGIADSNRVSKFASILRSWQATRPFPMRRPESEASHEPPYIEQLIDEAEPHLKVLSFTERFGVLRWDHEGYPTADEWSNRSSIRFDG